MGRQRSPDREKAFEIYKKHKGNIDSVEISKQLNLSDGTVRGWKNKDKWDSKLNGTFQINTERSNKKNNTINKEPKLEAVTDLENAELTDKQRLFCIYYIKYFNATKAYQKAYNCSYNTAMVEGCEHLRKPKIQEQIKKLKADKLKGAMLEPGDVLQKYIDIAFSDITDYVEFGQKQIPMINKKGERVLDDKGKEITFTINYVDFKESIDVDGSIISEIKQGKEGIGIKLHDKMKALDWLANHMDLLDTATKEKLNLEKQKFELQQKMNNLDEDIEYVVEDDSYEEEN